jgi:hypothetical protein
MFAYGVVSCSHQRTFNSKGSEAEEKSLVPLEFYLYIQFVQIFQVLLVHT